MKVNFTLLMLLVSTIVLAQSSCSQAQPIVPGTYNAQFSTASMPPFLTCTTGANNNPTHSIWYIYTPTTETVATISTNVEGYPNTDTRFHVYEALSCENLYCVTGDDDSGPNQTSVASFFVRVGNTYYVAFDNNWSNDSFTFTLTENEIPPSPFISQNVDITAYPMGAVDLNGDYLDDIVAPSYWEDNVQVLYQNADGSGFTRATISKPANTSAASWSMAAGDYDNNGYNDLLYGDGSSASILLANNNGTAFTTVLRSTQYLFSQRTNFVDINNDGHLDAFVCHDVEPNCYFLNDGAAGFTFHQGGLGDYSTGGNYGSLWTDYDNDGDIDLYLSKCRGGEDIDASKDELLRNNGDGTFTNVGTEVGFADYHQSWSSAWGDFDNDGDMDVMVGGSSNYSKLMRNNNDGTFTNVTTGSGFQYLDIFSREYVTHDFNNDGFLDLTCGGQQTLYNNGNMTFTPVRTNLPSGPMGDLNNDGFIDAVYNNNVYFGIDNGNNWIKILLQGTTSNRNGIGARVEILGTGNGWTKQIREARSGDGFQFMSSLNVHFGLGQTETLDMVVVRWPSGTVDYIPNPAINQSLMVTEGSFPLGKLEVKNNEFTLYPNPAKETLNIKTSGNFNPVKASIYSLDSKLVKTTTISGWAIPVQELIKGTYIIIIHDKENKQRSSKFIKT